MNMKFFKLILSFLLARTKCLSLPQSQIIFGEFINCRGSLGLRNYQFPTLLRNKFPKSIFCLSTTPNTESKDLTIGPFHNTQRPIHVKIRRKDNLVERKHVSDFTKSFVFLNDTYRCALSSGAVPISSSGEYRDFRDDNEVAFTLLEEFRFESPGYLHLHPPISNDDAPRLWMTNFGLTIGGCVVGVDLSGKHPVRKCRTPFVWPNSVEYVPADFFSGINGASILVSDGFLVPGKTKGNVWLVTDPGGENELAVPLLESQSWFYHKAVPLKLDGHEGVLTARANLPMMPFSSPHGELVWIEKPDTLNPLARWSLPWREVVLAEGPDVMFEVVDLDPDDGTVEVFAAEFFAKRLTMHSLAWDVMRQKPFVTERQIIDDQLGQVYSVMLADLQGPGSHLLVTTHEFRADPSLNRSPFHWIPGTAPRWTYTTSPVPMGSRTLRDRANVTVGGSLFSYRVPRPWRRPRAPAGLSAESLDQRLPLLFRQLDREGRGWVDAQQVEQALARLGVSPEDLEEGEVAREVEQADWDGSGRLDFPQFRALLVRVYQAAARRTSLWAQALRRLEALVGGGGGADAGADDETAFRVRLAAVFERLDRDGSGGIDMEEMRLAVRSMGVSCTDVELAAMFVEADWDRNGVIDRPEFESLMLRLFHAVRSRAGPLTRLERALRGGSPAPTAGAGAEPEWRRSTLASGFRVKRASINPGAPGFPYPFHPHARLAAAGRPPHILLAGDCADAAYVLQPVAGPDGEPHYEVLATLAFEGTVGSVAVGWLASAGAGDDGWAKFAVPVYETDRVYLFKFGPPPPQPLEPDW